MPQTRISETFTHVTPNIINVVVQVLIQFLIVYSLQIITKNSTLRNFLATSNQVAKMLTTTDDTDTVRPRLDFKHRSQGPESRRESKLI